MVVGCVALVVLGLAVPAQAHPERPSFFPDHTKGKVPAYRSSGPSHVVCKPDSRQRIMKIKGRKLRAKNLRILKRCRFRHIQAAVDASKSGDRILVAPGVYREEPSRAVPYPDPRCTDLMVDPERAEPGSAAQVITLSTGGTKVPARAPSYEYEFKCKNSTSLIHILGDDPGDPDRECDQRCNLQIEGTGRRDDQVILGDGRKLNIFKADRADGVYFKNLHVEHSDFNNFYVLETNGFRFDTIYTSKAREYGFLSFASDNGIYEDLEATESGDSGIYPGSGPEGHCKRYGIEVRRVDSYGNNLGFSGTAGNGVWVHHSKFHDNAIGMVEDSFAPGHPGQPQDCAKYEDNEIYSNNADLFNAERDAYCKKDFVDRDPTKVCPTFQVPVGTGLLLAGGNGNIVRRNRVWDNWRGAFELFFVPAGFRGESDPSKMFDTSHDNKFVDNVVGFDRDGKVDPNGRFMLWDEQGGGNCWEGNVLAPGVNASSDPAAGLLRDCKSGGSVLNPVGNLAKVASHATCATWDPKDNTDPPGCDWFTLPPEPKP
jgi:hypothetical protein